MQMNKRPIDKTKKSNIKCEHCRFWNADDGICYLNKEKKNYWNRCKKFEWKRCGDCRNYDCVSTQSGGGEWCLKKKELHTYRCKFFEDKKNKKKENEVKIIDDYMTIKIIEQLALDEIKTEIKNKCEMTINNEPAMLLHDIFEIIDKHIDGKLEGEYNDKETN